MKKTSLIVGSALMACALVTAPTALASPAEDALLSALSGAGISLPSRDDAIAAAELACNGATSGLARDAIAQQVSDRTGLDGGQSNTLVSVAQAVYCPLAS